ncbi:hypothetical protein [Persicobacter diffluens]|uniref:Uncharacterized protein n=1 Tax=Persicobacter diffluens TaxID=981 RepID=A0AAN4W4B1_9BACT|nr:hypothetical protein PEDI_45890 [Persicobacter diffluens]
MCSNTGKFAHWSLSLAFSSELGHQMAGKYANGGFTLASETMPKNAVGSVVGIGGMVGALTGMSIDFLMGRYLDLMGSGAYFWMFLIAGMAYLVILSIIHFMIPNLEPAKFQ